jgi:hypothetical protein
MFQRLAANAKGFGGAYRRLAFCSARSPRERASFG